MIYRFIKKLVVPLHEHGDQVQVADEFFLRGGVVVVVRSRLEWSCRALTSTATEFFRHVVHAGEGEMADGLPLRRVFML
jgi:hypothetical protein